MLVQASAGVPDGQAAVTVAGMTANLAVVIAGNLLGGSVLVGPTYHVTYRRGGRGPS